MTTPSAIHQHTDKDDDGVRRILVAMAHPDDVDFSAAGSIARWRESGIEVTYLLATHGEAGGFDDTPRDQMPVLRAAEQRAAAALIGVQDVRFLDYPDGALVVGLDLRRDIARVIRQVRPHRIVTSTPVRNFQFIAVSHPDHLAMGEATLCAVYPDARNAFAFPELLHEEGLEPWTVREVWTVGAPVANRVVDVTDQFERKISALRAHVSQTAHLPDLTGMLRTRMQGRATDAGLASGRLAETFEVINTR